MKNYQKNIKINFKILFIIFILLSYFLLLNNFVFAFTELEKPDNNNLSKPVIQKMNPIMTTFLAGDIPMPSFVVNQFNTLRYVEIKQNHDISLYNYKFVYYYDLEGRLLSMKQYNPDDSLKYKFVYVYNENKNQLLVIEIYLSERDEKPYFTFVNNYNNEDKLIKIQEHCLGFVGYIYIPVYSDKDVLIHIVKNSSQDEFICLYKFIYTHNNRLEKIIRYNDASLEKEVEIYLILYNKEGKLSEITKFNNYDCNSYTFVNIIE